MQPGHRPSSSGHMEPGSLVAEHKVIPGDSWAIQRATTVGTWVPSRGLLLPCWDAGLSGRYDTLAGMGSGDANAGRPAGSRVSPIPQRICSGLTPGLIRLAARRRARHQHAGGGMLGQGQAGVAGNPVSLPTLRPRRLRRVADWHHLGRCRPRLYVVPMDLRNRIIQGGTSPARRAGEFPPYEPGIHLRASKEGA